MFERRGLTTGERPTRITPLSFRSVLPQGIGSGLTRSA
jgi:hypothetical protein